jgi:hypothetical protein
MIYLMNILQDDKVQRNILSFLNAAGTLGFGIIYLYTQNIFFFNLAVLYPVTYYIYDTYIILNNKYFIDYGYLYHHVITLYFLKTLYKANMDLRFILLKILIFAELSNLPIYWVYHLIKTEDHNKQNYYTQLIKFKKIEIGWYILIRIIYFSYLIYNNYNSIDNLLLKNLSLTIYLLGIFWCFKQIKSLHKDIIIEREIKSL